jgi:hypothetical protein
VDKENKTNEINAKRVTLKELGQLMPLGMANNDGNYIKSFEIKRWRMKEEREIGEQKELYKDASIGQYVGIVLSTMCTNIGNINFESLKKAEKNVHISQMFVGDVFYIYTWLRRHSIGNELQLSIKCPNCSNKFKVDANLDTIEVDVCEKLEDACWNHKLEEPFEIRGRLVAELLMGPPKWFSLENLKGTNTANTGAVKAGLILGSIQGIVDWKDENGEPKQIALTVNELDEMGKKDIEKITHGMDRNAIGPNMSVEGECPRCRSDYRMPIDWSYDNFFDISGR